MMDILFALALFCVFAASALMVALIGARVYRNTVENMNINFDTRSSVTYVSTKIRQSDEAGAVKVSEIAGTPALLLEQKIGDNTYQTWIYHYDGSLREIFTQEGNEIDPEFGTVIMDIEDFSITQVSDNLYSVTSLDRKENPVEIMVSTRS
jgi:hypothetical protein